MDRTDINCRNRKSGTSSRSFSGSFSRPHFTRRSRISSGLFPAIGKKGVFFQVIMLVGFQFILFTAVILSMTKDSSTGTVTDLSSAMLGLDRKLDYTTSSSQVYLNSEINSYVHSVFVSGDLSASGSGASVKTLCFKHKGFQVINGLCQFDKDEFKEGLSKKVSDACYSYFKQSCSVSFDPGTSIVKVSSAEKETEYTYGTLFGTYDAKTSVVKKINEYTFFSRAKEVSVLLNSCSDVACAREKSKSMTDIEMIYSDPVQERTVLTEIVSRLDSCQRHLDHDCSCFTYDYNSIPENSEIVISESGSGYSADLIRGGNVIYRDFFRKNYASALNGKASIDFSGMRIKRGGIFSKDGKHLPKAISVAGSENSDDLIFTDDVSGRSCERDFYLSSSDDSAFRILSSMSLSNPSLSSAEEAAHISIIEDTSLPEGTLAKISVVSDEDSMNSFNIGIGFMDAFRYEFGNDEGISGKISFDPVSRSPKYSIYDQIPGMSMGKSGVIIIQMRVKSLLSYTEGVSDYSSVKETFQNAVKRAISSRIDVPNYPDSRTVIFRLKSADGKNDTVFFFAVTLEDKTPPDNARAVNVEYPDISDNTAFIRFQPSVSTDIAGYNVYLSSSQSLPKKPSFKVFLKSGSDADKKIDDFSPGNHFVRSVTKTVGLSGTYKAIIGSYLDVSGVAGSTVENTDMPERFRIYSFIKDPGMTDDDAIKMMRIAIKPGKDDRYAFLTAFDISGNENKAAEAMALDISRIQKIPEKALCDITTFSMSSRSISCETPSRTIFGDEWDSAIYGTLSRKTFFQCLDIASKDSIFDMVSPGFPTDSEYNSCVSAGKDMYFLVTYDTQKDSAKAYASKAKELLKDSWKQLMLDSGFTPYMIRTRTVSSGGSTSIEYYLESADMS